jgi:hypothetical protein
MGCILYPLLYRGLFPIVGSLSLGLDARLRVDCSNWLHWNPARVLLCVRVCACGIYVQPFHLLVCVCVCEKRLRQEAVETDRKSASISNLTLRTISSLEIRPFLLLRADSLCRVNRDTKSSLLFLSRSFFLYSPFVLWSLCEIAECNWACQPLAP